MGNFGHRYLVECIEQALWSESASVSSSEGTRVKSLEHGECNAVVDGLEGLTALVSTGVMQVIGCTVQVSGRDATCKGRQVFGVRAI